jgi:membrane protein implicated in regulation of membrane protease activity
MIPLGILGQFYFMSMMVGGAFIAINLIMGNLGEGSDGGDGGSGDGGGGGDTSGDDFGAGSSQGDSNGDDFGAADSANSGKLISTGMARTNVIGGLHHQPMGNHPGDRTLMPELPRRIGSLILSLLSPMSLALFLAFFGFFGLACASFGYLSILPAVIGSMLVSKLFKAIIRYLIVHGNVSSSAKMADIVGQIGEVNTPISGGYPGEITYVLGGKRYSSAAKSCKAGVEFSRGSKVWITERKGHLLLVDACDEADAKLFQADKIRG